MHFFYFVLQQRSTSMTKTHLPVLHGFYRLFLWARLVAVADKRLARSLAYRRNFDGKLSQHRMSTRQIGAGIKKSYIVRRNRLRPIVFLPQRRAALFRM